MNIEDAHDAPEEVKALEDNQEIVESFGGGGIRNRLKSTLLKRLRFPDRNRSGSEKLIPSQMVLGEQEDSPFKRINLKPKSNPLPVRKVQPKASGKRIKIIYRSVCLEPSEDCSSFNRSVPIRVAPNALFFVKNVFLE